MRGAGLIQTEGMLQYGGQELVDEYAKTVPMGRAGRPEEVASTIAFLASDGGAYITGATIAVDGGADAWGIGAPPPPSPGVNHGSREQRRKGATCTER